MNFLCRNASQEIFQRIALIFKMTEPILKYNLTFWIVSWGIIMNYVVGPSIQKWVHFTGSKAAILHISFLSLKPAKKFSVSWYDSVCFNSKFLGTPVKCIILYIHAQLYLWRVWPWTMFFKIKKNTIVFRYLIIGHSWLYYYIASSFFKTW